MRIEIGDLLNIREGIILHQVNDIGNMDKGLGALLCKKYDDLQISVSDYVKNQHPDSIFGEYHVHVASPSVRIISCFTEKGICSERKFGDRENTQYDAIIDVFDAINARFVGPNNSNINQIPSKVYIPFMYGCGLAGGNWNIVSEIINRYDFTVIARPSDYVKWYNKNHN